VDLLFSSRTYGLLSEREFAGGEKAHYAPLYEYVSMDAGNIGGKPIFLRFYGWGRADLGDDTGGDSASGEIASFYLEYLHPEGNAQARAGRFFMSEGVASDTIDGVFVKTMLPHGFGVALWGGIPVEYPIPVADETDIERGDSLYGGRLFFARSGLLEVGFSYLKENGSRSDLDRELFGGDLWLQVYKGVELSGLLSYDDDAGTMAQQRYAVRYVPGSTYDITAGYEYYDYEGLFHSALNPAFRFPTLDNTDQVGKYFVIADYWLTPAWSLEFSGKYLDHRNEDPGNAYRGEVGVRHLYNGGKDIAGASIAYTDGENDEDTYSEFRAFGAYTSGKLRVTLDAIAQLYKAEKENAYQVVATAGYQFLTALQLSGAFIYTRSPYYENDVSGLVRVSYDLAISTGGTKK
jgi:hypothetical protein